VKAPIATVSWTERDATGSHVCTLHSDDGGFELSGAGTIGLLGEPFELRFVVGLDGGFATRRVRTRAGRRSLDLEADALGGWVADGRAREDLVGCTDVDLECTPATNSLPIRRLGLEVGQSAEIAAAWVRFPGLTVERSVQRYERLAERTFRYSSGTFRVDLEVDEHGLVLDYPPFWSRES
jgi:hypothetical protein